MSSITFDETVLDEARHRLAEWIGARVRELPPIRDLVELTRKLSQLEYGFERARLNLRGLHLRGIATPSDYREFEAARSTVYDAQRRIVSLLRVIFVGHPDALAQIPSARRPPALGLPPTVAESPTGLGNPAAAAAIPGWMIGTIILGVIAALIAAVFAAGVIIAMTAIAGSIAAETIRDVWLGEAQLEAHNLAREERLRLFEACVAAGGSREQCRLEAMSLVPDPPIVNPGSAGAWVPWVVGGVGLLVAAGGGLLLLGGFLGRRGSYVDTNALEGLRGAARRLTREQYLSEPDQYGLEVSDP